MTNDRLQALYYWLNSASLSRLSAPLRRDVETRAIERFFLDWTLTPSNDGRSPGYMYDLPALCSTAQPGTVLWHAVRAIAFAGLKNYDNGAFSAKARQNYGSALTGMRIISDDSQKLTEDRVLAALLLIDTFEKMFLSRREPLGAHKDAMRHILTLRGERQFEDRTQFELWRAAQQRLQAHRISHKDGADNEQLEWIGKLNASLPDLHVCADVERMVVLCSAAGKMVQDDPRADGQSAESVMELRKLLQSMHDTADSMAAWSRQVDTGWRPRKIDAASTAESHLTEAIDPALSSCGTLEYADPWLAYKWNFHKASQVVLRQSMVEIMHSLQNLQVPEATALYDEEITTSIMATEELATTVIASCIPLLGFSSDRQVHRRGKMVSRFFAICSLSVVDQARLASPEQKSTARALLEWVERAHSLD